MTTNGEKATVVTAFPTLSVVGIAFIVLKLTDQIDWAWKWVLAPFWIPWVIVLCALALIALVVTIADAVDRKNNRKVGKGKGVVGRDGRRY